MGKHLKNLSQFLPWEMDEARLDKLSKTDRYIMIRYCGRDFTPTEITQIRALIKNNPQFNRTRLSIEICRILQWFKPDGKTKDMSCRVAMLKMEKDGVIYLPPSTRKKKPDRRIKLTSATDPQHRIVCPVHRLPELNSQIVTRATSALWNEYIERYHYLGISLCRVPNFDISSLPANKSLPWQGLVQRLGKPHQEISLLDGLMIKERQICI